MARIVAKRSIGTMPVFNMEVYGLHNYVTPFGSVLHNCRYFVTSRTLRSHQPVPQQPVDEMLEPEENMEEYMCGGEPSDS